jgi:hypothetical protein
MEALIPSAAAIGFAQRVFAGATYASEPTTTTPENLTIRQMVMILIVAYLRINRSECTVVARIVQQYRVSRGQGTDRAARDMARAQVSRLRDHANIMTMNHLLECLRMLSALASTTRNPLQVPLIRCTFVQWVTPWITNLQPDIVELCRGYDITLPLPLIVSFNIIPRAHDDEDYDNTQMAGVDFMREWFRRR